MLSFPCAFLSENIRIYFFIESSQSNKKSAWKAMQGLSVNNDLALKRLKLNLLSSIFAEERIRFSRYSPGNSPHLFQSAVVKKQQTVRWLPFHQQLRALLIRPTGLTSFERKRAEAIFAISSSFLCFYMVWTVSQFLTVSSSGPVLTCFMTFSRAKYHWSFNAVSHILRQPSVSFSFLLFSPFSHSPVVSRYF